MVSFSKRRRKNLTLTLLIFLFIAIISGLLFWFWQPEYFLAVGVIVGFTGLVAAGLIFYQRRTGALVSILIGLLICAGIYLLRDEPVYHNMVAALIGEPNGRTANNTDEESDGAESTGELNLTVRVFDDENNPIANAQVLVFLGGPPTSQYTDSNGVAVFDTRENEINAKLVINHPEHDIREELISITSSETREIKLTRKDDSEGKVIVYVVDNETNQAINGSTVTIVAEGNVFNDVTDDNGIARFPLDFPTGQLDVEMNVATEDYITANRSLTVRPNGMQTVRLNANDETIVSVAELTAEETSILSTEQSAPTLPPSLSTEINPVEEVEPNGTQENPQVLDNIGMEFPVQGAITAASDDEEGDLDWYQFTAVADQTYVVELYNVANNIDLGSRRYTCDGLRTVTGLRIIIFDPAGNEVDRVCEPSGRGNVHTLVSFVAGTSGNYTLQIAAHAPQVFGDYSLRILPKYDDEAARWDPATYEPNNTLVNAFSITPGYENALTSVIESRQARYSTSNGDVDIYRFTAVAGQSYVIELFNVANNLTLQSRRYTCGGSLNTYTGLWFGIYDPGLNLVTQQCAPNGVGNVHSILSFTAGSSGDHFIRITPHEGTVSGNYSLRVLPRHGQEGASWDEATFEPNNRAANAYELTVDAEAVRSRIEHASNVYSTRRSDADWYRFEVVSGSTYVVEVLDVDNGMATSSLRYTCGGSLRTYNGLWLGVFDDTETSVQTQCPPNGNGNIHTLLEFTAARSGTFYVQLYPHNTEAAGEYSIRVRQQ